MLQYTLEGQLEPLRSAPKPVKVTTWETLGAKTSRGYKDMRNRAAYIHVTGCHASNLRVENDVFLCQLTGRLAEVPDPKAGPITIKPEFCERFDLDNHPMVVKVNEFFRWGFRVIVQGEGIRRRYHEVRIEGLVDGKSARLTVLSSGAVLDHWE